MSDLNVGHFFKPRCEVAILWGHICIQCHLVFYCGVFKICEAYQMPPISDTKMIGIHKKVSFQVIFGLQGIYIHQHEKGILGI